MQKERDELFIHANKNKDVLFSFLEKNNAVCVVAIFDGSGDSGSVKIEITPESLTPLLIEPAIGFTWPDPFPGLVYEDSNVRDAIEVICYDFLRAKHQGWQSNEGSYGTFEFDVEKKKVILDYNEREVSHYSDEF